MIPLGGSANRMTPPSPYVDLMTQRRPLHRRNTHFRPNLKFTSTQDKRDNFLPVYQMVPLPGSVIPMTPPSPYSDLMAQRRPLQKKHTFSTKREVHFYIATNATVYCPYIKWSPTGFCKCNDTALPLCGLDGSEKTSLDQIYIFKQTCSSLLHRKT